MVTHSRGFMMLWWFTVISSFFNAVIVFGNIVTDNVRWITWLNGIAAVWLALLAGPYPEKQESKE